MTTNSTSTSLANIDLNPPSADAIRSVFNPGGQESDILTTPLTTIDHLVDGSLGALPHDVITQWSDAALAPQGASSDRPLLRENDTRVKNLLQARGVKLESVWHGVVLEINASEGTFTGKIGSERGTFSAEFRLTDFLPDERRTLRVGSEFYLTVGTVSLNSWRPPSAVREIRLRRLPPGSKSRRDKARARARELMKNLEGDGEAKA